MEKEKIDYNKYTHEINFIKVKEHTFMQKVRKRLTKNKIFIIVIPSFFFDNYECYYFCYWCCGKYKKYRNI